MLSFHKTTAYRHLTLLGMLAWLLHTPVMAKTLTVKAARASAHAAHVIRESRGKPLFHQIGRASWYGKRMHGQRTASGEAFDSHQLTGAHPTLPFGTMVKVTNLRNGRSTQVRINDRGPFSGGRIIDLSQAAAKAIDMMARGVARVRVEALGSRGAVVGGMSGGP